MKKLKTIPTIIGILLLLAGIGGGVYLIQSRPTWLLRAQPTATPQQIKRTNITDRSLTISWTTQEALAGFVRYGTTAASLDTTALDDRDAASGQSGATTTHYVTLRGLVAGTTYYFKIGSGQTLYDNNGQPHQVTTAPTLVGSPPASDLANGIVNQAAGSPAEGVIVYLTLANTSPLSALTTNTGSWVMALNNARNANLSGYASYDRQASTEEILVQAGIAGTATAVVTTGNDNPVPTITLGNAHDFRLAQTTPTPTPTTGADTSGFILDPLVTPTVEPGELAIINPTEEESLATQRPEIFGQGPAGIEIEITVQSPATQSGTIISAEDGSWSWVPPDDLEPGEHTVTARYVDESGLEHLVSRLFVVLAAEEELPSFEATPSGEASPTPTLTITPTATPTGTPTATPSGRVSVPSTETGIPESGYLTPTFLLFIMGAVLVGAGLFSRVVLKRKFS